MSYELLQISKTIGFIVGFCFPFGVLGLIMYAIYRLIKKYTK